MRGLNEKQVGALVQRLPGYEYLIQYIRNG